MEGEEIQEEDDQYDHYKERGEEPHQIKSHSRRKPQMTPPNFRLNQHKKGLCQTHQTSAEGGED